MGVELQSHRMKVRSEKSPSVNLTFSFLLQAFFALTALAATASAAPQIFRGHGVVGHAVAHPVAHAVAEVYPDEISPYTYNYAVADDYSNSNFNAAESSDGAGNAEGSYSVALPDGRVQHVNYHSDPV